MSLESFKQEVQEVMGKPLSEIVLGPTSGIMTIEQLEEQLKKNPEIEREFSYVSDLLYEIQGMLRLQKQEIKELKSRLEAIELKLNS
jgi:hypothetical protein